MKRILIGVFQVLLPVVILAAAGLGALTMIWNRPPVETLTPVVTPPGVRVHEVSLVDVPLTVASQGTVRPRTESQLVSEIDGRVIWVAPSFVEGGFFEPDEVLVRIDPFDYEQAVITARSQLAQARLRLAQEQAEAEVAQREWDTLGRGDPRELALRKPQLEDARAAVAAAEASVERAVRDLQRAEVPAPYAGRVRTKNVDIGQYVRRGDALATVYSVDFAEIRLPLPDDELAYLDLPLSYRGVDQPRQPDVTLRATFGGRTHVWEGRIVRTESEIDSVSRMVHAVAEIADPYAPGPDPNRPPLAVGMFVEAEIDGRIAREVVLLPRDALRGRDQVLVVAPDERLEFRTVDVLRSTAESLIVQAGLATGERVVISPLDMPIDGMAVQVVDAAADPFERRVGAATATDASAGGMPLGQVEPEAAAPTARPAWLEALWAADEPTPETDRVSRDERVAAERTDSGRPPGNRPHSLSVLPFDDLGAAGDTGADADLGVVIVEALSKRLSGLPGIGVVADEDGAAWVVGGALQRVGSMVRVTARLTDTRNGAVLSAVKVDGTMEGLADLQDRVAAAMAAGVRDALAGEADGAERRGADADAGSQERRQA